MGYTCMSEIDHGDSLGLHAAKKAGSTSQKSGFDLATAFDQIRKDIIGRLRPVDTPFGRKPLVCEFLGLYVIDEGTTKRTLAGPRA